VVSQGSDIVTKKRSRLTGDSIRMIVCLKEWSIFTDEHLEEESGYDEYDEVDT
jgi:hypothetical protein